MKIFPTVVCAENETERDLAEKRAVLDVLERELLQRELELATLQGELAAFERRYMRLVGILQARLDELDLRIADLLLRVLPDHPQVHDFARQTRLNAWESAQAAGVNNPHPYIKDKPSGKASSTPGMDTFFEGEERFQPSGDLKQTYRDLAKRIHPDLAADAEERALRTRLMIEANIAFQDGDAGRLRMILHRWENSPHHMKGEDPAMRLERLNRRITQVRDRLEMIDVQISDLNASDIYQIKKQADDADAVGIDLLSAMAERLKEKIYARQLKYREVQNLADEEESNRPDQAL